jgi:ABC-2 type transport system permease protein
MRDLFKIEFTKLSNHTSFKVLLGLHFALFSLSIFILSRVDITVPGFDPLNLFRFPHVWEFFTWIAGWFNLLLAILVIMATGNEFAFRTFRQHVFDGLSRTQLLLGKLTVILTISLYSVLLVFLSGLIYGVIYSGGPGSFLENLGILPVYFLQAAAYMVSGLIIIVMVRNTALAIILFILWRFPLEPIVRSFFDPAVRAWFPMKAIGGIIPMPEFLSISSKNAMGTIEGADALSLSGMGLIAQGLPGYLQVLLVLVYVSLFLFIVQYLFLKRDF